MSFVRAEACAKINLSLDIVGKRNDGYHFMDMVMQSVNLCDTLELKQLKAGIDFFCSDQSLPKGKDNLAVRAASAFFEAAGISGGVSIRLKKRIPSGAGMAGGSADAAAVLAGLNALYNTPLPHEALCELGLKLGADVPFCLIGGTARVTGIGEKIEPLPALDSCFFAALKPDFSIYTKEAFSKFDQAKAVQHPDTVCVCRAVKESNLVLLGASMYNVFEQTVEPALLHKIKRAFLTHGACGAAMTGSGSVIYGIFEDRQTAMAATAAVRPLGKESFVFEPVPYGISIALIS